MHERGQATTEYVMLMVGVVALAALLLAAMPRLAPAISGDVRALVCRVAGGDCSAAPALPAVGTPPAEDWYRQFVDAGPRGALLADINDPTDAEFAALVDQGDTYLNGGETSRRSFTVAPQPGRGVVAIDFFIPDENSLGLQGDDRPEEGTNVLRSDLPLTDSRIMIVIDFETGRGVITQTETTTDLELPIIDVPLMPDVTNEPRPIVLNGDGGPWSHEGGIDLDETNQFDIESDADGVHIDWDVLNSITPFIISVDGDVTFTEGEDGFLQTDDFANQDLVDRYPQIQVWQYLPDGREREIGRNDYQGGHMPVQGALPHCDGPDLPNLPDGPSIGPWDLPDLPDLPNLPSVPGPC